MRINHEGAYSLVLVCVLRQRHVDLFECVRSCVALIEVGDCDATITLTTPAVTAMIHVH
jgi:hypothetical protein